VVAVWRRLHSKEESGDNDESLQASAISSSATCSRDRARRRRINIGLMKFLSNWAKTNGALWRLWTRGNRSNPGARRHQMPIINSLTPCFCCNWW